MLLLVGMRTQHAHVLADEFVRARVAEHGHGALVGRTDDAAGAYRHYCLLHRVWRLLAYVVL